MTRYPYQWSPRARNPGLQKIYESSQIRIVTYANQGDPGTLHPTAEVRQGGVLLPLLFILVLTMSFALQ